VARIYPDISYGPTQKQQVDIHEPEDYNFVNQSGPDPKGVVIYLHGGGWAFGDKAADPSTPICVGGGGDDKAQCSIIADAGWVVISANYDLLGPDPDPDPCPGLAPRGDGYAPNNILQIAELIRFLVIPGYATGVNQATWELMNRYVLTRGLMVTGGSAGGHLAIAGAFEAASNTGYWPRGMMTFVGPMDIFPSPENPIAPFAQSLIDTYTQSSSAKQQEASPWWRKNDYTTYPGFDLLANPDQRQVKTHVTFWYNTNDTLTPSTSVLRFRDWILDQLGPGYALTTAVTEGVPDPDSHNITTTISGAVLPMTAEVFYQGLNYPVVQQKLRPTQGMVYPRPLIYRYPRQP
jgi:acetyl esterase/lipase